MNGPKKNVYEVWLFSVMLCNSSVLIIMLHLKELKFQHKLISQKTLCQALLYYFKLDCSMAGRDTTNSAALTRQLRNN